MTDSAITFTTNSADFVLFVEYCKEKCLPTFGLNANKIAWNS